MCGSSNYTPPVQVSNLTVVEGQQAVFNVTLASSNSQTVVNLGLFSGTATVGSDFSSQLQYLSGNTWINEIGRAHV